MQLSFVRRRVFFLSVSRRGEFFSFCFSFFSLCYSMERGRLVINGNDIMVLHINLPLIFTLQHFNLGHRHHLQHRGTQGTQPCGSKQTFLRARHVFSIVPVPSIGPIVALMPQTRQSPAIQHPSGLFLDLAPKDYIYGLFVLIPNPEVLRRFGASVLRDPEPR